MQINGVGSDSNATDCSVLCPSIKDVLCRIKHKCWRSLATLIGGLVGLLAAGAQSHASMPDCNRGLPCSYPSLTFTFA